MRDWKQVWMATDMAIFSCDPQAPWQRHQWEYERPAAPVLPRAPACPSTPLRGCLRLRPSSSRPTSQDTGRNHTGKSHAASTVWPRKAHRCDDRL